ncbi:D-serine ammonia-lyase [Clostridium sp. CF012]|uniref:D-serine ammonia-lyase n=1 Tax=Clostridium sp. CF012 TaxID=2843319 RepID=UPI001C0D12A3|nr:D-serine ammonia-lyase [Clostridium sp. CF012]MBU3143517.1 D-serine ammonia-lyase [Clostridium sp. CF012]
MINKLPGEKTIDECIHEFPLLKNIIHTSEVFWVNPKLEDFDVAIKKISLNEDHVKDAENRLTRFAPLISKLFPETKAQGGLIESPIYRVSNMQSNIENLFNVKIPGVLLLKCDSHLPIAGSIKARGGIYEVLKHTEDLALQYDLIKLEDDYSIMAGGQFSMFFSKYTIQVGSTGNLGLSIGIMSAKIGFKVIVHMSSDAKQWKKDLLRSVGVTVIEYQSDYSVAVSKGRAISDKDPMSYFVDDENSTNLFLGYSTAAFRLKKQLEDMNVIVDSDHPLFVYLPCGVGGGPGGVAFGLKLLFKDNVHCFFAEPTHSPCMLLGLMTEQYEKISVQDFGIDNITQADGLAVGTPSGFVARTMQNLLSGVYTVEDNILYMLLSALIDSEDIYLEPSACAGIIGAANLFADESATEYLATHNLTHKMTQATHIAWATGGSLVPKDVMDGYYRKGKNL